MGRRKQQRAQAEAAQKRWSRLWWLVPVLAITLSIVAVLALRLRRAEPVADTVAVDGSPSWSPDGTRIVFYSERAGNGELYVMESDGSEVRRLTDDAADEGYPNFSPDGRLIAFDSDRSGNFDIYVMNADGSNVRQITRSPARDVSASWSHDGASLVFMSDRGGQGFDVYEVNVDGGGGRRLTTTGSSWFPMFSPDGDLLAFHVGRDVHVMDTVTWKLQRLTTDPANGMYPSWSPDGKRITFMSWRNGKTEVFVMNKDGSGQRLLVSMPQGDAIDPRWSPDGSRIVFVHMPGGMNSVARSIWVVDTAGGAPRQLTGR